MSDDQFIQLRDQVTRMDTRIDSLDKGFVKMFKYMSKRFDEIDKKLDKKADKSAIDLIYKQLDGFLKRTDVDKTERAALTNKVDRHEGWIHQIAKTTGDQLSY